jgi:hypothetical protein
MSDNPFWFFDRDGSEWVSNGDGTYRCLHAELTLTFDEVVAEFGPIHTTI